MKPRQESKFRTKPNFLYATTSVALILFLISLMAMLLIQGDQWIRQYQENIDILVEVKQDAPKDSIRMLVSEISRLDFVLNASVAFVSKEEGAAMLEKDFGTDLSAFGLPNPLYDIITFNLPASYLNPDSLAQIRKKIKGMTLVHDLYYQDAMLDQILSNMEKVRRFGLLLSFFLLLMALHLIYNTYRLALYANRLLIKNMEMVGASWSFISRPFLIKSMVFGLLSSSLAVAGIAAINHFGGQYLGIQALLSEFQFFALSGIIALLGTSLSVLSTWALVRRYLRMRMDDLY